METAITPQGCPTYSVLNLQTVINIVQGLEM